VKWSGASQAVARLASQIGAALLTSAGHRDAVDNAHPLFLGQFGPRGSHRSRELVDQADLIVGIGTRFGFNSTFYSPEFVPPSARLVQIDIEPEALGRYFPTEIAFVSDALAAADALVALSRDASVATNDEWVAQIHDVRREVASEREAVAAEKTDPIQPASFLYWLSSKLPARTIVTVDAGTCGLMASEALEFGEDKRLFTPLDFGCLGFAHPAAIGAKVAAPDRTVVSISGDGGFGFSLADIATAVENEAPVTSIVLDNGAWGAEKAYQRDFFDGRFIGADIASPAYDRVAEAFGAIGVHATSWSDVESSADLLFSTRPVVYQVDVDPGALRSFRVDSFKHRAPQPAHA
jgi:acetolactate synthase-1/2/3 large subunit/sulfoacetaldehyde acetyltransferase